MSIRRRDFLSTLLLAVPAARVTLAHVAPRAASRAPHVVNHNRTGSSRIVEGRTLLVSVILPRPVESIEGSFPVEIETAGGLRFTEEQPLYFHPAGDGRTFRAILTAPLDSVVGRYSFNYSASGDDGFAFVNESVEYRVARGNYRRSVLKLARKFSAPSSKLIERRRREFETLVQIYKGRTPRRWRKTFIRPVRQKDFNNFGVRRIVNQSTRYRHAGLDFRAPVGTHVKAINDGVVVLSTTHWSPGQLVCIDHGGGLFSRYIHLSRRYVRLGEAVRRGQVIALSGRSGGQRPAPHLHMDVVLNGSHISFRDLRSTAARMLALERSSDR